MPGRSFSFLFTVLSTALGILYLKGMFLNDPNSLVYVILLIAMTLLFAMVVDEKHTHKSEIIGLVWGLTLAGSLLLGLRDDPIVFYGPVHLLLAMFTWIPVVFMVVSLAFTVVVYGSNILLGTHFFEKECLCRNCQHWTDACHGSCPNCGKVMRQ